MAIKDDYNSTQHLRMEDSEKSCIGKWIIVTRETIQRAELAKSDAEEVIQKTLSKEKPQHLPSKAAQGKDKPGVERTKMWISSASRTGKRTFAKRTLTALPAANMKNCLAPTWSSRSRAINPLPIT